MVNVYADEIRLIQPSLTVLVSSTYRGMDALLTVGWVMPVSYVPSRVAIAVSPERYSYNIIAGSGMYAINILEYEYVDSIYRAGTISGRDVEDKYKVVGLTRVKARTLPIHIVGEAIGVLECRVINRVPTGDHELFIGEVVDAYVKGKYVRHWDPREYKPILYISEGHFMTIDRDSIKKYFI